MFQDKYNIQKIAQIMGGRLIGSTDSTEIHYLVIDSRKIIFPEFSLFFAIKGQQHDGHEYLQKAIDTGIRNFVVSDENKINHQISNAAYILVEDTLVALQKLAAYHRLQTTIPIVGITGSNGKTIVKDWLSHVLSINFNVCRNPKSYNSQVGVPLSIWNLQPENEIGIFEAGISKIGEMEKLESILKPTMGIFTNIGTAHEEGFTNIKEKIEQKLQLFKHSTTLVLRNDDEFLEPLARKTYPNKEIITWGSRDGARFRFSFKKKPHETEIFLTDGDKNFAFSIPFTDSASIENAVHVFVAALILGGNASSIIQQMALLPQVNMRLSFKTGKNNCFIIDDTYSNDFDSLKIAIDSLSSLTQYNTKTIILSDIAQSKGIAEELYRTIGDITKQKQITRVIGVGKEISEHSKFFPHASLFFKNIHALMNDLHNINFNNEAILIKGARVFELEKIVTRLEDKVHDTVLEVNLNAMVHNLNYYRSHIPTGTKIMAMVKASGYGTGTHEIAHILHFHHVNYLAVAYTDEGIELRNHGIELPIMVMNAETSSYELLIEKKLEPVIYNFENLLELLDHKKNGYAVPPIHIELDTGMHRLGFDISKIDELIGLLQQQKDLDIKSVFSHLAAADEPDMDDFTKMQLKIFKSTAEKIERGIGKPLLKHIANSAGASRFKDAAFDMIRLGVGLYGVGADSIEQSKLQPVISLFSTIAQISHIKKGESIGYGRSFIADKDITIATIPIGYADGYRRSLGNGKGKMFVHGKSAPIVGRVCMDMTMINITEIDAEVGDIVEVIGENNPIEVFAKSMDTIPYEVLTSISQRVRRIYTQE